MIDNQTKLIAGNLEYGEDPNKLMFYSLLLNIKTCGYRAIYQIFRDTFLIIAKRGNCINAIVIRLNLEMSE